MSGARLDVAGRSDRGRVRENNEDCFLIQLQRELPRVAVIDGMGGHLAGEVASRMAREELSTEAALTEAVERANHRIREDAVRHQERRGMGCVLTAVEFGSGTVRVAHVGDTRAYLARRGSVSQLTRDHTMFARQREALGLEEEEARQRFKSNELLRDVGGMEGDDQDWIDSFEDPFEEGDVLLLCSDGLTDVVSSEELLERLARARAHAEAMEPLVDELIQLALDRGGPDNVTVVAVRALSSEAVRGSAAAARVWIVLVLGLLGVFAAWGLRPAPVVAAPSDVVQLEDLGDRHGLLRSVVALGDLSHTSVGPGDSLQVTGAELLFPADAIWEIRVAPGAALHLQRCSLSRPDLILRVTLEGADSTMLVEDGHFHVGALELYGEGELISSGGMFRVASGVSPRGDAVAFAAEDAILRDEGAR